MTRIKDLAARFEEIAPETDERSRTVFRKSPMPPRRKIKGDGKAEAEEAKAAAAAGGTLFVPSSRVSSKSPRRRAKSPAGRSSSPPRRSAATLPPARRAPTPEPEPPETPTPVSSKSPRRRTKSPAGRSSSPPRRSAATLPPARRAPTPEPDSPETTTPVLVERPVPPVEERPVPPVPEARGPAALAPPPLPPRTPSPAPPVSRTPAPPNPPRSSPPGKHTSRPNSTGSKPTSKSTKPSATPRPNSTGSRPTSQVSTGSRPTSQVSSGSRPSSTEIPPEAAPPAKKENEEEEVQQKKAQSLNRGISRAGIRKRQDKKKMLEERRRQQLEDAAAAASAENGTPAPAPGDEDGEGEDPGPRDRMHSQNKRLGGTRTTQRRRRAAAPPAITPRKGTYEEDELLYEAPADILPKSRLTPVSRNKMKDSIRVHRDKECRIEPPVMPRPKPSPTVTRRIPPPPPLTAPPPMGPPQFAPPPVPGMPPPLKSAPPPMVAVTCPPPMAAVCPVDYEGEDDSAADSVKDFDDSSSMAEEEEDIYGTIAEDFDDIKFEPKVEFKKAPVQPAPEATKSKGFREMWYERREVQESGVLGEGVLTKKERSRQEAMYEIYTSEQSYKKSLDVIRTTFMDDLIFGGFFETEEYLEDMDEGQSSADAFYGNMPEIMKCSEKLCQKMKELYADKVQLETVAPLLREFVDKEFQVYIPYCAHTSEQQEILKRMCAENEGFQRFLHMTESADMSKNLGSLMIQPMQRICRMPLLLSAVLKETEPDSPDLEELRAVHKDVCALVDSCNEEARKADTRRHMAELEKRCNFSKIKSSMTSFTGKPDRLIVKDGQVIKLNWKGSKLSASKIHLWLFTDCAVIGAALDPKKPEEITLTEHCPRQLITVTNSFAESLSKKKIKKELVFHLSMTTNPSATRGKHWIQCEEKKEVDAWMEVLKKKTPKVEEDEAEKIYESWDTPRFVALYAHEKKNEDDLELEVGDICQIIRKYTDGWCYGIREKDEEKGWFPITFMEEIESDHMKFREQMKKLAVIDKITNSATTSGMADIFSTIK